MIFLFAVVAVGAGVLWLWEFGKQCIGYDLENEPIFVALTDPARFKILWATAQIVGTVGWVTSVAWPQPFAAFSKILGVAQLEIADVVPIGCISRVT